MIRNKKAISPVIATVIIVAVAIAVAIAVAYWVTGIIPAFTRYEEIKIVNIYIEDSENAYIDVLNSGSADATIDNVYVKGQAPLDSFSPIFLASGDNSTITVLASDYPIDSYKSGVIIEFKLHTSSGGSYPVSARAP